MKRIVLLWLVTICSISACAVNTGVVQTEEGNFKIFNQAATGFIGLDTVKEETFNEGKRYCEGIGKEMLLLKTLTSTPPHVLGNFPNVEIQFRCTELVQNNK